jgi:Flp pilus assembly pilin Flp
MLRDFVASFSTIGKGERGEDLVEYALLGGLIAFAIAGATVLAISGGINSLGMGLAECIDWDDVPCV